MIALLKWQTKLLFHLNRSFRSQDIYIFALNLNLSRHNLVKVAWETRYFVWKFENFDEIQLPCSSIFFAEYLHTCPTYQCLQKGGLDFFYFV